MILTAFTICFAQFGGDTPLLYDTRQWYCHDSPGYPLGEIQVGNLGKQLYFARSSNPWIKHECDLVDDLGNAYTARALTRTHERMRVPTYTRSYVCYYYANC